MKVICCTYYNNTASLAYNWLAFQIWNTPVWKLNEHHKLKKLVYMHYPPIYHTWLCCIANVPSLHVKKEAYHIKRLTPFLNIGSKASRELRLFSWQFRFFVFIFMWLYCCTISQYLKFCYLYPVLVEDDIDLYRNITST